MPSGGRPSASVRALQTATIRSWRSGGAQRDRDQPRRRRVDGARDAELDRDRVLGHARRAARTRSTSTVSAAITRVAQVAGLVAVEPPRLVAVGGVGEVEVARHPQQLVAGDRRAGAVAAERDVGLDRREVAAAVEDDRQLVAQREAVDPHRDRGRPRRRRAAPAGEAPLPRRRRRRGARSSPLTPRRSRGRMLVGSVAGTEARVRRMASSRRASDRRLTAAAVQRRGAHERLFASIQCF